MIFSFGLYFPRPRFSRVSVLSALPPSSIPLFYLSALLVPPLDRELMKSGIVSYFIISSVLVASEYFPLLPCSNLPLMEVHPSVTSSSASLSRAVSPNFLNLGLFVRCHLPPAVLSFPSFCVARSPFLFFVCSVQLSSSPIIWFPFWFVNHPVPSLSRPLLQTPS